MMKIFKSVLLISISVISILAFRGIGMAVTNPATTSSQLADDLDINYYSLLNVKGIMGIRNAAEFSSIQAAIDDVYSSDGGGLVFVPPGTYTINTGIVLKDNIALVGAGWATILKQADDTDANVIGSGIGPGYERVPAKNVVVANLQIDGNKANQSPTDPYDDSLFLGILFDDMTNARIENVYIHDTYYGGISLFGSRNSVVKGNLIVDISGISQLGFGSAIEIDYGANNNRIIGNRIHNSGDSGIWMTSQGATTYGNILADNIITSSRLKGISIGSEKGSNTIERTIIANNQIMDCGYEGISIFVGTGEIPNNPGQFGERSTVYNTIVMNNLVLNNGITSAAEGIYINTRNPDNQQNTLVGAATIAQSNIVRGSGTEGIRLGMWSEDTIVADNIVLDNASAQIYNLGIRTVLSGNKEDTTTPGLTVKGLVGLSSGQTAANNLRDSLTIPNGNTTGTVPFGTAESDTSYYLTVTPTTYTGTPAAGSNRIKSVSKTTTGFTVTLESAPGTGNSRTFDWHLFR